MTEGYKTRHDIIDELIPDGDLVTAGTLADEIDTGDYVDFGPYGTLYVVERYDDNTALVNGSKKAIRNSKPIGWVIDLRLAERIVAKYVWEEDFPNQELNEEITKTCPECGSKDVDRGPHGYVCRSCGAPIGWTEGAKKTAQRVYQEIQEMLRDQGYQGRVGGDAVSGPIEVSIMTHRDWEEDVSREQYDGELEEFARSITRIPGVTSSEFHQPQNFIEVKFAQQEQRPYTTGELSEGDRLEVIEDYSVYSKGLLGTVELVDSAGKAKIKLDTPVPNPITNDPNYALVGSNGLKSWKFSS